MPKPSFQEWFCLADGRKNFQIDPVQDQAYLFGEPDWEAQIDTRLRRAQLLGLPVRLMWWGQYGIGKTHRLHHTEHLIHKNGYNYYPCYAVASDIQEKTGFERLHFELVNALGRDHMREIVSAYFLKIQNKVSGVRSLKELCGTSSDVEAALQSFGGNNEKLVPAAWRFLCGRDLDTADQDRAGVTRASLESSIDYATVLGALAAIIQHETGKELFYLVDEAENLGKVSNKTAVERWRESLRTILDIKNLSIIFTIGAERQDGIPKIILEPDIVRRIQKDNYVVMEAYKPPTAKSFVRGLIGKWVDPARRAALELAEDWATSVPDYKPEFYPFTEGGFDKFCEWSVIDPRTAKPSEIIARLNNVAAEAYFKDRRLINRDHLTEMGIV
jgi:hypothetical protein